MSLDALGNLGDFIGGIGVIVTLAYLALQIRQNTIAMKADSYQSVVAAMTDWSRDMSVHAGIAEILNRGARDYGALDTVERMRFNLAMSSYFRNMENLHMKFITGAVDAVVWEGWSNRTFAFLRAPGTRQWWQLNESAFSPDFRSFVANLPESAVYPEAFTSEPPTP